MSCVSTDGTNFLAAGKKVAGHYVSGVSACSQYDVHIFTSMPRLDAGAGVLDSAASDELESALSKSRVWVGHGFKPCRERPTPFRASAPETQVCCCSDSVTGETKGKSQTLTSLTLQAKSSRGFLSSPGDGSFWLRAENSATLRRDSVHGARMRRQTRVNRINRID